MLFFLCRLRTFVTLIKITHSFTWYNFNTMQVLCSIDHEHVSIVRIDRHLAGNRWRWWGSWNWICTAWVKCLHPTYL